MNNQRATGAVVAILGLLLTCCICPLVLDNVMTIGSGVRSGLYSTLFSGSGNLAPLYVIFVQLVCIALLALIVLVVGIVLVMRGGQNAPFIAPVDRR